MKADNETKFDTTSDELDQLILSEYPYPVAVNYRRLLEIEGWEARTRKCIEIFEYGLRTITLVVLSQYLIRDVHQVSDLVLDRKLYRSLPEASLGQWTEFFFLGLRAYRGRRDLFFMREMYDLYWDTSQEPHQPRKGFRAPFSRLVEIRNDLAHRLEPDSEAAWQGLGQEALGCLLTILEEFSFLQNYDLIRIVGQQGDEYEYERYTGQEITTARERLQGREEGLRMGWFYLSRQDRSVLRLHPMLIFWSDKGDLDLIDAGRRDVAVYDRLLKETVGYVATVVRQMMKEHNAELVAQFRELIYYNIEHIKMAHKRTMLSWGGLRQAAVELTTTQMGTLGEKYQPELYLQRDETFRKFREFLTSDRGCFVLTGKSGVGKSNFVLSLVDEYAEQEDICFLMYNGARLSVPETMVQTISQDLGRYLTLEGELAQNLFAELDRQGQMRGKTLTIVFDAINENSDGKRLLRQIDHMVGDIAYPWLKVVITSRPQAWRVLKRGLRLAKDRYYRERGSDEYWVELQEFAVEMEPFKLGELPEVYEKYRKAYGLQTEYEALRAPIRSALRDPLMLRLVADIHRGRSIPEQIQVSDIYTQFVQALLRTGRLDEKDIVLLEQELMPLMIAEGHYDNKFTASQIHTTKTSDGRPLWELIRSEDMLSNGQRVNESYVRLTDAEILVELNSGLEYTIGFKYERFYEFFAGRRLCRIGGTAPSQVDFYEEVIAALPDSLFLWGALVQALTLELINGNFSLFADLAAKNEQDRLRRHALVSVITQFGEQYRERADAFLWELIGPLTPPPRTFLDALWRLLRPVEDAATELPIQKAIAVEAAAQLKITELLVEAAGDASPRLRAVAAQHSFYLWQKDNEAGFQVLEGLSRRVKASFGIPNLAVAESMLAISGAILVQATEDTQTLSHLLTIGRRSLRQILFLGNVKQRSGPSRRFQRAVLSFLHRRVLSALLGFLIKILAGWKSHASGNLENLPHVFELSREQKDLLQALLPFLEPDEPGLAERFTEMLLVLDWGDYIAETVVNQALWGHCLRDIDIAMPVLRDLMNNGLSQKPPKFWVSGLACRAWRIAARQDNPAHELRELVEKAVSAIQENPGGWHALARQNRPVPYPTDTRVSGLGTLIGMTYLFQKNVESDILHQCLEKAMAASDDEYLKLYVTHEATIVFEYGQHEACLRALQPIAAYDNPEVQDSTIELLVRARRYDPETVEDLLLQGDFPPDVVACVSAYPASERLNDLITYQVTSLTYDLCLLGPQPLRMEYQWLISQALKLSNIHDWFVLIAQELINLVTGELVFSVPDDAPSRQILE
jgi:hypothetical protein